MFRMWTFSNKEGNIHFHFCFITIVLKRRQTLRKQMSKQINVCVDDEAKAPCEIDYEMCCGRLLETIETLLVNLIAEGTTDDGHLTPFVSRIYDHIQAVMKLIIERTPTSEQAVRSLMYTRRLLQFSEEQERLRKEANVIERKQLELMHPAPSDTQPADAEGDSSSMVEI